MLYVNYMYNNYNTYCNSPEGSASLDLEAPHTITQWIGSAVCTNEDVGLGVSEPVTLNAFQPFFVSVSLPYSVVRGEELPVIVTASNYLAECFVVSKSYKTFCSMIL